MQKETVNAAGLTRYYYTLYPTQTNANRPKTVFFFKGKGRSIDLSKLERVFRPFCDKYNVRMIFPEAHEINGVKIFNVISPLSDLLFIDAIMAAERLQHGDLLLSGISNGGCFALLLATIGYSKKIVTFAASLWEEALPIPAAINHNIVAYHGQADTSVPYNGGYAHGVEFLSALQSVSALIPGVPMVVSKGTIRDTISIQDAYNSAKLYSYPNVAHDVFGVVDLNEVFDFLTW